MNIIYTGKNQKIIDSISFIEDLSDNADFWRRIEEKDSFDYSNFSPRKIAQFMREKEETVVVKLYRPPFYRHRNTNAYADPQYPNTLFYNSKKLWRSVGNIVNTVVHEYVHSVDFTEDGNSRIDYGHGSQSSSGKSNAAPYWIGSLAESFYNSEKNSAVIIESTHIDLINVINEDKISGGDYRSIGFSGQPLARWDGYRNMILEEDFSYTDPRGRIWLAPKGSCINGATMPRFLWSVLGSPFTGKYRRASVVHDVGVGELCNSDVSKPERKRADRMFYHACRSDSCSRRFAAILYIGVRFGTWRSKENYDFLEEMDFIRDESGVQKFKDEFWSVVDYAESVLEKDTPEKIDEKIDEYFSK